MMDFSVNGNCFDARQLRLVQQLLWSIIEERLTPAERDEVKRAIGVTLVDGNQSLYEEANALSEIIAEVQFSTADLLNRHEKQHKVCRCPRRDMVEDQIRSLIERLRIRAVSTPFGSIAIKERDPDTCIPKSTSEDKAVFEYITTTATCVDGRLRTPSSRPGTASSSRPATASRPASPSSRPGTAASKGSRPTSTSSTASSSIEPGLFDKLNAFEVDSIKTQLQTAFEEERRNLLEDVDYLATILDEETDMRARAKALTLPKIEELEAYSGKLIKVCELEKQRIELEAGVSLMFQAAASASTRPGKLRTMVGVARDGTAGTPTPKGSSLALQDTSDRYREAALNAVYIKPTEQPQSAARSHKYPDVVNNSGCQETQPGRNSDTIPGVSVPDILIVSNSTSNLALSPTAARGFLHDPSCTSEQTKLPQRPSSASRLRNSFPSAATSLPTDASEPLRTGSGAVSNSNAALRAELTQQLVGSARSSGLVATHVLLGRPPSRDGPLPRSSSSLGTTSSSSPSKAVRISTTTVADVSKNVAQESTRSYPASTGLGSLVSGKMPAFTAVEGKLVKNLLDSLEAEVHAALSGGVRGILEKHSYGRPATPKIS